MDDKKLYNTSTVYSPQGKDNSFYVCPAVKGLFYIGDLVAIHRKLHLFDIDIPGKITFQVNINLIRFQKCTKLFPRKVKSLQVVNLSRKSTQVRYSLFYTILPYSTRTIDLGRIGIAICYDVRFPEMAMIAAREGCVAMIYPGAFNMTTGPLHWELLARAR